MTPRIRRVGWAVAVSVVAIGLSACGSSHHHSYSVRQVVSAFAAHGMMLRLRQRTTGAVVALVARGGVRVLVEISARNLAFGWTGEKPIERGNVIVFRPAAYEHAVNAALQDLR
jgi:hypothetical protein